jgi:hypothetical protein
MKRFFLTATLAALGLTVLGVNQTQAGDKGGHGHRSEMSGRHDGHHYRASSRFGYDRFGYKSFRWTRSYWSSYYRCYCYWAPSYGWCFYEPTYSYYVPVSRFSEVYPEATRTSTPSVVQQTTVVTVPSAVTPVPAPGPAVTPPPVPEVGPPAPTAVQQTKVGG